MPSRSGGDTPQPRRPTRANGQKRYEALVDAAERLLRQDAERLPTVQMIAREAGVPMASVYHFMPSPAAISIALSERYMAGFAELVGRPIPKHRTLHWPKIIAILIRRAVRYYREHPYAEKLILGSDHSWAIRRSDIANNRHLAGAIVELIADKVPAFPADELLEAVVVGITVSDAVFTLSIAEHGHVTDAMGEEAIVAACAYLAAKVERGNGK